MLTSPSPLPVPSLDRLVHQVPEERSYSHQGQLGVSDKHVLPGFIAVLGQSVREGWPRLPLQEHIG